MQDISGFGFRVVCRASNTFPSGFDITQFADDADPFDSPAIVAAEFAMGLNADLVVWSVANPIITNIGVIPGSDDDRNLSALLEANRVGKGKSSARDIITLVGIYPEGRSVSLVQGKITGGPAAQSIASAGRMKSNIYTFVHEQVGKG